MQTKSLGKLKILELEILKEFDRICKKHNLNYTVAFGTVLGAVRHQGFIPWDDDIDVHMKYEDYKKFEEIVTDELDDKFYFQCRKNNVQNFTYWNRIGLKNTTSMDKTLAHIHADWGICIDIFPLLPLGNTEDEVARNLKVFDKMRRYSLKYLMINTMEGCGFVEKLKKGMHKFISDSKSVSLMNKYFNMLGEMGMDQVKYCTGGNDKDIFETKWFKETKYVTFEDIQVPIMIGYDAYLKRKYGDYMILPKEEERVCHVSENSILKFDEPYQRYYK